MRREGMGHLKIHKDPRGIEPGTSRLVTQYSVQWNIFVQQESVSWDTGKVTFWFSTVVLPLGSTEDELVVNVRSEQIILICAVYLTSFLKHIWIVPNRPQLHPIHFT